MPVAKGVVWGRDFAARIGTGENFRVHSVFEKVCNLKAAAPPLLALVVEKEAMGPNSLLVEGICFKELLDENRIINFKGGILSSGLVKIDCREVTQWQPQVVQPANFRRSLEWLQIWVEMQYPGLISVRSAPVHKLQLGLQEQNKTLLTEALEAFIGVGPGLTPTGDDFVAGALTAYVRGYKLGRLDNSLANLLPDLVERVSVDTNTISQTMLWYASRGEGASYLTSMVDEIIGNGARSFERAVGLLQVGSSSGRFLLAGVLLGCEICLRELNVDGTKDPG